MTAGTSEHLQQVQALENEPALKEITMLRREPRGPHSVFSLIVEKRKLYHRAGDMHHGGALTFPCVPRECHGTHILLWKRKCVQRFSSLGGALIPHLKVTVQRAGARLIGFKWWLSQLLVMGPWANHLSFLSFTVLVGK